MRLTRLKLGCWQDCFFLTSIRENPFVYLFQKCGTPCIPWLLASFYLFETRSRVPSDVSLLSSSHLLLFLWSLASLCRRPLWLFWGHMNNPRYFSISKSLTQSYQQSLFCHMKSYKQFLGIQTWTCWEAIIQSTPYFDKNYSGGRIIVGKGKRGESCWDNFWSWLEAVACS